MNPISPYYWALNKHAYSDIANKSYLVHEVIQDNFAYYNILNVQFMNDVRAASESSGSITFTLVLSFLHNPLCTVQVCTVETVPVSAKGMR